MQNEDEKKLQNGKKILQQIKDIKSDYEYDEDDRIEEEMSFIDRMNRLFQLIVGDSSVDLYRAMDQKKLDEWNKRKLSRWIKKFVTGNIQNTLYFLLLATITGFLVSEAVQFYAIDGAIGAKTWVKAILTEISFIFISGYRSTGKLQMWWVNFLRAGVFCLMMFVISSQAIDTGTRTVSENTAIAQQVVLLEKQIEDKQKEIDYYISIEWPKNATGSRIAKEKLVNKLIVLKDEQASGKNEEVSKIETYKMYGRAAFRVLLLFISVLITRRIFIF